MVKWTPQAWAAEVATSVNLVEACPDPPEVGLRRAASIPSRCLDGWIRKQLLCGHFAERLDLASRPRVLRQIKHAAIYLPRRN